MPIPCKAHHQSQPSPLSSHHLDPPAALSLPRRSTSVELLCANATGPALCSNHRTLAHQPTHRLELHTRAVGAVRSCPSHHVDTEVEGGGIEERDGYHQPHRCLINLDRAGEPPWRRPWPHPGPSEPPPCNPWPDQARTGFLEVALVDRCWACLLHAVRINISAEKRCNPSPRHWGRDLPKEGVGARVHYHQKREGEEMKLERQRDNVGCKS